VKEHPWHYSSNAYIATSMRTEGLDASGAPIVKKREVYLHTFLMNPGPGQIVQHISKQGLDNRRENLRVLNATDPAANVSSSSKKKRSIELPPMCGIAKEEIPKHIWYVQANGYHRDRFAIEFKTEKILWKSTSSKSVSLQEKLKQAKEKLAELYETYPHLDPKKEEERIAALTTSFEAALRASEAPRPSPE
jgi:hypothetical protein